MKYSEYLKDVVERESISSKWEEMINLLTDNRIINQTDFCKKHGINTSEFSRWKSGKITPVWETVHKVQRAFKAEMKKIKVKKGKK